MANKQDLIAKVAEATELTKKDSAAAVDAVFASIEEFLAAGEKVQLIGFGNFEVRERAARQGRNPQTGETISIAASKVPAFKAGKALNPPKLLGVLIYTKNIRKIMKTITVVLIFLLVFTVIKLSAIVTISKLMKPSEKQIEEARQKRIQAQKEGKDTFEVWDERDDDSLV